MKHKVTATKNHETHLITKAYIYIYTPPKQAYIYIHVDSPIDTREPLDINLRAAAAARERVPRDLEKASRRTAAVERVGATYTYNIEDDEKRDAMIARENVAASAAPSTLRTSFITSGAYNFDEVDFEFFFLWA